MKKRRTGISAEKVQKSFDRKSYIPRETLARCVEVVYGQVFEDQNLAHRIREDNFDIAFFGLPPYREVLFIGYQGEPETLPRYPSEAVVRVLEKLGYIREYMPRKVKVYDWWIKRFPDMVTPREPRRER